MLLYNINYHYSFTALGHSRPFVFTSVSLPATTEDGGDATSTSSNGDIHGSLAAVMQYGSHGGGDSHNTITTDTTTTTTTSTTTTTNTATNVRAVMKALLSGGRVSVILSGLRPNTRYALLVKAYNSQGAGPSSPAVTVTTKEDSE